MDKRIELTEKQKEIVKRLGDVFKEIEQENIGVVLCYAGDHYVMTMVNKTEVLEFEREDFCDWRDEDDDWFVSDGKVILSPNPDQVTALEMPCDWFADVCNEEKPEFFSVVLNPSLPEELEEVERQRINQAK